MNGFEPNQKYADIPPKKPNALDYVDNYASILSILFIILFIINRVKSTKDPQKEVNRKKRMKIYLGLLIVSVMIVVISKVIELGIYSV